MPATQVPQGPCVFCWYEGPATRAGGSRREAGRFDDRGDADGRGYSVLEVINVVKKVSGVDFPVRISPRRPGDPAQIVAKADRIREELGWRPRHDDLDGIVYQALAWERALKTRNQR